MRDAFEVRISGMFVPVKMWFEEGKFKMWTEQNDFVCTYEVGHSKDPKWITLQNDGCTNKPNPGSSFRGLYSLEDDRLIIFTNVQRRPESLDAAKSSLDMKRV
ncbi:MAG: hypothetical protein HKN33_16035 [Pyrinomonadaceae bacterium]|nr:hypothetical protein [Pyrinomonadaceae bacterium]